MRHRGSVYKRQLAAMLAKLARKRARPGGAARPAQAPPWIHKTHAVAGLEKKHCTYGAGAYCKCSGWGYDVARVRFAGGRSGFGTLFIRSSNGSLTLAR
jgi:hypothetical protein